MNYLKDITNDLKYKIQNTKIQYFFFNFNRLTPYKPV